MNQTMTACFLLLVLAGPSQAQLVTTAELERLGARYGTVEKASTSAGIRGFAEIKPEPSRHRAVAASFAGLVTARHVGIGDEVAAGDLLLTLASPEALTAQTDYLDALDAARLAHGQAERDALLLEDGLIAPARAAASRAAAQRADRRVSALKLLLEAADLDPTRLTNSGQVETDFEIRAPIDGHTTMIHGDPGERLEVGAAIAEIVQFDVLLAELRVPVDQARTLRPGMRVTLGDGLGEGTVEAIARAVDPDEQTVLVRTIIEAPAPSLNVGQRVPAEVSGTPGSELRQVPEGAIVNDGDRYGLFVVAEDGARFVPVTPAGGTGRWQRFTNGPALGTRVVTGGTAALKAHLEAEGGNAP